MKTVLGITIAASLLSIGCFNERSPVSPTPQQPSAKSIVAVSISMDYSEGNMGLYNITDSSVYKNLLSIYSDNDIRAYDGSIYVLERYGKDNIIKITGSVIADSTVAYEKNIGASVNIQDVAFVSSTKAYVTQYGSSQVAIFNPSTGTKAATGIDLSAFNAVAPNPATVPYMSREQYYDGKVYVSCQRLGVAAGGAYPSVDDTSKIAVIDAATDAVVKAINLVYKNPQEMSLCNGKLYVAGVGLYGVNDGGIECIDLATGLNTGSVVDEAALHGDVSSLIVISDTKGYAVVATPAFTAEMYAFNPQTKTVGAKIAGVDNPCWNHMAYDGTYVYVGDRSATAPGIVVIDPATDRKVGATKDIGIPPNSLAFLQK